MKRILLLLVFIAAVCANAVEVRVKLKDGSNVSGIPVWQNDKQMGIATSKDGRAAMRSVDKKDIVDITDVTAEHEAEIARIKAMAADSEKRTEEVKKQMEIGRQKFNASHNKFIRQHGIELKLKDGSKISGMFASENDKEITLRMWETDHSVQKTINRSDIVEFVDHRADSRLAITQETKKRIEKELTDAEEEVRRRQKDVPNAQKLLDDRVQLKGAQIAVEVAKAKVEALRNEIERVTQEIERLEKQRRGLVK